MISELQKAVRTTPCLSCGAKVPIYSRASVQVVCPYCRSTLVRNDLQWDDIGKMAAVASDLTPLHIGLRGSYQNINFTVIGRLQQQYSQGVWNEWLLQLDNNQSRWLSEGSGLYYLTSATVSTEVLPSFSSLKLGDIVTLAGRRYSVSNIEQARCIACEGEISFVAEPNETANLVDLVGEDGNFASLDYSDQSVKLYTGEIIAAADLDFGTLDLSPLAQQSSIELRCSGCGNAVSRRNPASLVFACSSCQMVNNLSSSGKLIHGYSQILKNIAPAIMPGSFGVLEGHRYEAIGFMRRSSGMDSWDEYMLYNPSQGIRWLVCASGHWSLMKTCAAPGFVTGSYTSPIFYNNRTYKHFSEYGAKANEILGEFYWQVKRGELNYCTDYINPPYILCLEKTGKEHTWSEGHYIASEIIADAFAIAPGRVSGQGINQPSPAILGYICVYLITVMCAFFISSQLHLEQGKTIEIGSLILEPSSHSAALVSEPFTLEDPHALLRITTQTSIRDSWAEFEYSLTNQDTGETRMLNREVSYYSGYDSDGSWSEGSPADEATLANVVAGHYVLEVNGENASTDNSNLVARIKVDHALGHGSNFLLLLLVLGIGPVLAGLHKYFFEKRRWSDSDHPWE